MAQEPGPNPGVASGRALSYWRDVLLILTLMVFGLWSGAGFLVPLALAVLIFVLITAVSDRIRNFSVDRIPMPAWLANLAAVAVVLAGLFAVIYVLGSQATQFARAFPTYETQLEGALARVTSIVGNEVVKGIQEMFVQIDISLVARSAFGGASSFLSTFLLICLYVAFMMAERQTMARKLALAFEGKPFARDLPIIMATISDSLQRYVSVKTFVSTLTALFSYSVFRFLGLEFAETWAVLTFALNFIPSIGSVIAVIFPALVSLVQFDTAGPFLTIVLGCGLVQFLIGNILDPALLGRSLNLSTLMVMLALTFWTAVWGIIGAFLSVPLTVCILIVLCNVPATRPLAILMSQDGTLNTATPDPDSNGRQEG